jgi:hypothetical protein
MVMVTGIICGAAVTAIITVGTGAADIIMDGTGADITDIHNIRQGRLEDEAAFFATSQNTSVNSGLSAGLWNPSGNKTPIATGTLSAIA